MDGRISISMSADIVSLSQRRATIRKEADLFIDALVDMSRSQPAPEEALDAVLSEISARDYTSIQVYLARKSNALIVAGLGLPERVQARKSTLPITHPVLEEILHGNQTPPMNDGNPLFEGKVIGFPYERRSIIVGEVLRGAVIFTYDPVEKEVNTEEHRLLERSAGVVVDTLQKLVENKTYQRTAHQVERAEAELKRREKLNGATRLFNERVFHHDLKSYLNKAQKGKDYHLVLMDIDQFSRINREADHIAGDEVIADVGKYLGGIPSVAAYRAGGDKFALVLETAGKGVDSLLSRGRDIREGFAQIPVPKDSKPITASVGMISVRSDFTGGEDLYSHANASLSMARDVGNTGIYTAFDSDLKIVGHYTF